MDVVSYCFGVPPEQYLAEGIDRSLIRRAMWGLLPDAVLTNRLSGLQARGLVRETRGSARRTRTPSRRACGVAAGLPDHRSVAARKSDQDLACRGWHTKEVFQEYIWRSRAGSQAAGFLRWFEQAN